MIWRAVSHEGFWCAPLPAFGDRDVVGLHVTWSKELQCWQASPVGVLGMTVSLPVSDPTAVDAATVAAEEMLENWCRRALGWLEGE